MAQWSLVAARESAVRDEGELGGIVDRAIHGRLPLFPAPSCPALMKSPWRLLAGSVVGILLWIDPAHCSGSLFWFSYSATFH